MEVRSGEIPIWMRFFVLQKKLLQPFQTEDYKIQKILEDINFILHLSCFSDTLGVMNCCKCYLKGPGSNIVDFVIKLTTSGVGKVRPQVAFFDPRDVAFQLFVRNTKDLFCFAIALAPPISSSFVVKDFFFVFSSPICISCGVENFFCSLTHRWQLFGCATFSQVVLSMKILPTLGLPSFRSSIHNNDSHIVRFLRFSVITYAEDLIFCLTLVLAEVRFQFLPCASHGFHVITKSTIECWFLVFQL